MPLHATPHPAVAPPLQVPVAQTSHIQVAYPNFAGSPNFIPPMGKVNHPPFAAGGIMLGEANSRMVHPSKATSSSDPPQNSKRLTKSHNNSKRPHRQLYQPPGRKKGSENRSINQNGGKIGDGAAEKSSNTGKLRNEKSESSRSSSNSHGQKNTNTSNSSASSTGGKRYIRKEVTTVS